MGKNLLKKKEVVKEFTKLIDSYPVISIINVESLPAKQLQKMREKLRAKVVLKMVKTRLLKLAIENSQKKNINLLLDHLEGIIMILFSKDDPFSLYKILKQNKSTAPAKAGQTSPKVIIVPKGNTGLPPGPMISELGGVGIKTAIENGKIVVKEDSQVAKTGDIISDKLAKVLTRLNIEPMEIGLNLVVAYENGKLLTGDLLDIDEEAYLRNIKQAYNSSLILATEVEFLTKETISILIGKAYNEAISLGVEQNILEPEIIKKILSKANSQSHSLYNKVQGKEQSTTNTVVETKEEKPKEDKKNDEESVSTGMGALFG